MKRRGFTLVELLAVIIVLSLILVLVAPAILGSSKATKQKLFETKVVNIETAATTYGQDNYRKIINGANACANGDQEACDEGYKQEVTTDVTYRTQTISVRDLVPTYLAKDGDNGPFLIQDPRDGYNYLDDYTVTIRINTNTRKVTAKFNDKTE